MPGVAWMQKEIKKNQVSSFGDFHPAKPHLSSPGEKMYLDPMKNLTFTCLCCFLTACVFAQTGNDSTDRLLDSARHYIYSNSVKSYHFISELNQKGLADSNNSALAYAHQLLGILDEKHGDNEAARRNYKKALAHADMANDGVSRLRILTTLSNHYLNLSQTDTCIELCHQGIREAIALQKNEIASQFYNNLSLAHSYIQEYDQALTYADKSIELKKEYSDEESLANAYLNKGLLLTQVGNYEDGFRYYSQAEALYLKYNTYHALTQTHINFAWDYTDLKQFHKARPHLARALYYAEKSEDKIRQAGAWNVAGYYYRNVGYTDSVVFALEKGLQLSLQAENKRNALVAYQELSSHYQHAGNTKLALQYLTEAYRLKDGIFDEAKIQLAQSLNARYETAQKEEQIKLLNVQQENDQLTIQKQRLTLMSVLLLVIGVSILLYFLFVRYRKRQEDKKERELQSRKQAERMRIARDMHDEIGAGLTRMVMRSRQVKTHLQTADELKNGIAETLDKMESESRQLSHNIGEIIWALNPENDTLDTLCAYLRNYAYEYLEEAGIETTINFPDHIPATSVSPEVRRSIFLILKESLNNLVKHSNATQAGITLTFAEDGVSLVIQDNGRGMDLEQPSSGNGLGNMKKRAEEIQGKFVVNSAAGRGMTISIENIQL